MKQKKHIVAGALLLAMLTGLLGGCGNNTAESQAAETSGLEAQSQVVQEQETTPAEQPESAEAAASEETSVVDSSSETEAAAVSLPLTNEPVTLTYWTTVSPMYADAITSLDDCLL